MTISAIKQVLQAESELELAVLVGSQSDGHAHADSDWDIAIQWNRQMSPLDNLANTETLRRNLALAVGVTENLIDLIDMPRAGLTMRALVAEEGIALKGEDSLAWNHFLARVWRELEDFQWEKLYAA